MKNSLKLGLISLVAIVATSAFARDMSDTQETTTKTVKTTKVQKARKQEQARENNAHMVINHSEMKVKVIALEKKPMVKKATTFWKKNPSVVVNPMSEGKLALDAGHRLTYGFKVKDVTNSKNHVVLAEKMLNHRHAEEAMYDIVISKNGTVSFKHRGRIHQGRAARRGMYSKKTTKVTETQVE